MYRIGDFSRIGQVSVRMLRHYDQMGLLTPDSVDASTGYRSYSIEQLPRLNRILFLKDLGFSLQQVKDMLSDHIGLDEMKALHLQKQHALEEELAQASQRLDAVRIRLEQIENEGKAPLYEVMIKESGAMVIGSVRAVVPSLQDMADYCKSMHEQLYALLSSHSIEPAGPEITLYHNKEYDESNIDVEIGVRLGNDPCVETSLPEPLSIRTLPKEKRVASLIYKGPYEGTVSGVLALFNWVTLNGWDISGSVREIQLSGPTHDDAGVVQKEPVTELQVPLQA